MIQENPKIEARVGWHHQLTLGEERQIFCTFRIFFGGWGGRAAQKYKISTDDTSPTSRNCQKYVDEKNTLLFACVFFFAGGGGQGGAKNTRSLLFERLCSIDHLNL